MDDAFVKGMLDTMRPGYTPGVARKTFTVSRLRFGRPGLLPLR